MWNGDPCTTCSSTILVPIKCEIIIPGLINNDDWTETTENALFEPVEEGLTDVMIARALVDPKMDIYLHLLNLSERAIKLEKGTLIGHLYSVIDLVEFKEMTCLMLLAQVWYQGAMWVPYT